MSTPDLAEQMQHLDQRLEHVEAVLQRLEQMLMNLQGSGPEEVPAASAHLPKVVRIASPRLRHREQVSVFEMVVTPISNNGEL